MKNPKSEIRNPKEFRSPKSELAFGAASRHPASSIRHPASGIRHLASSLLVLLLALPVCAQYSMDWFTVDGGGGTSTGGVYAVTGTLGQPDTGAMSGGPYTLTGGFWSILAAIQTEGAPRLSIERLAGGSVRVSWPKPATGFVLEQTATLQGQPPPWTPVALPYQSDATHHFITVPLPAGTSFYRLRKP